MLTAVMSVPCALQLIQEKVNGTIQGANITVEHTEAQYSHGNGILLQVDGRLTLPDEVWSLFLICTFTCQHNTCNARPHPTQVAACTQHMQMVLFAAGTYMSKILQRRPFQHLIETPPPLLQLCCLCDHRRLLSAATHKSSSWHHKTRASTCSMTSCVCTPLSRALQLQQ